MDADFKDRLRNKEILWRSAADDIDPDEVDIPEPDVFIAETVRTHARESNDFELTPYDLDGKPDDHAVKFEATKFQMEMGRMAATMSIFFFKFSWFPFFSRLGYWCMRRAYWFSGGDVPFHSNSKSRDGKYLEGRAYRGP